MTDGRIVVVPLFLLAQAVLIHWAAGKQQAPAPPALASFPSEFPGWRQLREDPITADITAELKADRLLSRSYTDTSTGSVAGLFVAWFQSQHAGAGQPHSPKVCLPAAGWTPVLTGEVTLNTAAGVITINRYIVVTTGLRDVVLYWYQGPHRVTAGEWDAKLWLMADALRYKRTDTALVRIVVPSGPGGDQAATAAATGFARNLYPILRESLPR